MWHSWLRTIPLKRELFSSASPNSYMDMQNTRHRPMARTRRFNASILAISKQRTACLQLGGLRSIMCSPFMYKNHSYTHINSSAYQQEVLVFRETLLRTPALTQRVWSYWTGRTRFEAETTSYFTSRQHFYSCFTTKIIPLSTGNATQLS